MHLALKSEQGQQGNIELGTILSKDIDQEWPKIEHLIEKACDASDGEFTPEYLYEQIKSTSSQCWCAHKDGEIVAIMLTQIEVHPTGKKKLFIMACAGKGMHFWKQYIKAVEAWGKYKGCSSMEARARRGWLRILNDYKESKYILIEKEL